LGRNTLGVICTSRLTTGSTVCQTLFHLLIIFVILCPTAAERNGRSGFFPGSSSCTPDGPVPGPDKYCLITKELGIDIEHPRAVEEGLGGWGVWPAKARLQPE
jgi:hypothetical protein